MKPTATSSTPPRPLVNDADLAGGAAAGKLGGAALDVITTEPMAANSPLLHAPTSRSRRTSLGGARGAPRLMQITAENVAGLPRGQPINLVN